MTYRELAASVDAFATAYDGQYIDIDKRFGNQCWDLAALYGQKLVGNQTLPTGPNKNALECYTVFSDPLPRFYTKHAIGTVTPRKGDLIIWGINHIAIYLAPTATGFISLDQNWPLGNRTQRTAHTWNNVIGLLRPIRYEVDMINDLDNEYGRWHQLGLLIRGRALSREEFRAAAVGRTWLQAIEILMDNSEAMTVQQWQNVGAVAVRDKWDQQIYDLQDARKTLQRTADELAKRPTREQLQVLQSQIRNTTLQAGEAAKVITPAQSPTPPTATKISLLTKLLARFVKPSDNVQA